MTEPATDTFWFDQGIRFECTECGACCTGGPGAVFLSDQDIERLTRHLKMDRQEFLNRYTHPVEGQISLREKDNTDCIFLHESRCRLHAARPVQCRTYPFWFARMRSEHAWQQTCLECPGIGRGRLYHREEILDIIDQDLQRPRVH